MGNHPRKTRYFIKALAKGLSVLQAFGEKGHPLTASEIANALGVSNSTSTRLCYTLTELGFIQRDSHGRYNLTPKTITFGYSYLSHLTWWEVVNRYLESLYEKVQETVNLAVLDGSEIIYLIRMRKAKYLPFDIRMGTKLPVFCTAMGKVLMAMGPEEKIRVILKTLEFKPLTVHTIMRLDDFIKELEKVREKGYAIADEELSLGIRAIGAPIVDKNGYAIAAINITVPTAKYSLKELEKTLAPEVKLVASQISKALLKIKDPLVMGDLC